MTQLVRRSFDRRAFLRGLGSAGLVVPGLLRSPAAQAAGRKKVVIYFVGGGVLDPHWHQSGRASGPINERPLTGALSLFDSKYASLRNRLTVIEGAHSLWNKNARGDALFAHDRSVQCALTCTHVDDPEPTVSLDRRFAAHLRGAGQDVPFASLMFCATRGWVFNGRGEISRNGDASLSTLFTDPIKAYERVFMGVKGGPIEGGVSPETQRTIEVGILNAALEQCEIVRKRTETLMGREAARQVTDQCDSIRDMERRLRTGIVSAEAGRCTVPERPAASAFGKAATFHPTLDAYRLLGVNALACNLTNVITVEVWRDQPDEKAVFQGGEFAGLIIHLWHFHKNNGSGGTLWTRARADLDNRTMEDFARWGAELDRLRLLDDGLALWATNEPRGDHSVNGPSPCFYMGSLGGKVRTGQYLKVASPANFNGSTVVPSINEVYAALLRGAGLAVDTHGPKKYHRTGDTIAKALLA